MTREIKDFYFGKLVASYKVSINFKKGTLRVWYYNPIRFKSYERHLKADSLTLQELEEVREMTYNDFRQFLRTDIFYIWR